MKRHADIHARIARPPAARSAETFLGNPRAALLGDDNPYRPLLRTGHSVSRSSTSRPRDGFTFLSDADAETIGSVRSAGTVFIARPRPAALDKVRFIPESLPALLAFKHEIVPKLGPVPYVEGDSPIVCAWYPTARRRRSLESCGTTGHGVASLRRQATNRPDRSPRCCAGRRHPMNALPRLGLDFHSTLFTLHFLFPAATAHRPH